MNNAVQLAVCVNIAVKLKLVTEYNSKYKQLCIVDSHYIIIIIENNTVIVHCCKELHNIVFLNLLPNDLT